MLPTPRTSDSNGAGEHGTGGPDLRTVVSLLPTPTAADGKRVHTNARSTSLGEAVATFDRYADAVERWAQIFGTEPPAPTIDGKLNPAFPEWMMGFPAEWVTDPELGLTRSQQLKAIGNAQQPQVAALAFALLADRLKRAVAA